MEQTFAGKPGDLIQIFRGLYQHWAVYIGENEVVHFTTDGGLLSGWFKSLSSSTGKVKREKLTDVVGNDRYQVNNLLDNSCKPRDPSIIVKEACEMVGRQLQYDLDTYNSKHFATDLRYGVAESRQVNITAWLGAIGVTAAALVIEGPVVAVGVAGAAVAGSVFRRQLRSRSRSKEQIDNF